MLFLRSWVVPIPDEWISSSQRFSVALLKQYPRECSIKFPALPSGSLKRQGLTRVPPYQVHTSVKANISCALEANNNWLAWHFCCHHVITKRYSTVYESCEYEWDQTLLHLHIREAHLIFGIGPWPPKVAPSCTIHEKWVSVKLSLLWNHL